jgi:AraC-like DNA-binding protein
VPRDPGRRSRRPRTETPCFAALASAFRGSHSNTNLVYTECAVPAGAGCIVARRQPSPCTASTTWGSASSRRGTSRSCSAASAYLAISFEVLDGALLDPLVRLVKLLGEPPRHLWVPRPQIAKAVARLKQNFVETLKGDELADRAHMSPSTFRQHFRALTGVSPMQCQKQLRLQGARQLMLNEKLDAGSATVRVAYESASQFSREYSRLFGAPPQRDITRNRLNVNVVTTRTSCCSTSMINGARHCGGYRFGSRGTDDPGAEIVPTVRKGSSSRRLTHDAQTDGQRRNRRR